MRDDLVHDPAGLEDVATVAALQRLDGALLDVLWPVHNGLLRYTGFDVLAPFAVHAPGRMTADDRTAVLEAQGA